MSRHGFTLIELLITISIIAILSAIGITMYGQVTMNARDARRKLDLQNIAQALEVYYQKNNSYPITNFVNSSNPNWIPGLVPTYMSSVPQDPKSNGGDPRLGGLGYTYCSGSACSCVPAVADGQWYILATVLENTNDSERMASKHYKWCDGQDMFLSWSDNSYVISSK